MNPCSEDFVTHQDDHKRWNKIANISLIPLNTYHHLMIRINDRLIYISTLIKYV
jgi:hypothetical protein